jgi:hypothetical protein
MDRVAAEWDTRLSAIKRIAGAGTDPDPDPGPYPDQGAWSGIVIPSIRAPFSGRGRCVVPGANTVIDAGAEPPLTLAGHEVDEPAARVLGGREPAAGDARADLVGRCPRRR